MNHPDGNSFPQQRRGEHGSNALLADEPRDLEIGLDFCGKIMDVDRLPVDHGSPDGRTATDGGTSRLRTGICP